MQYKNFKGNQISTLGFGALRMPMDPNGTNQFDRAEGQRIIDAVFDAGINYFDTAYTYIGGDSERFLGETLSAHPRDSYYLTTKFYAAAGKAIDEVFEEQLRRCKTDYFDFYMFHSLDENFYKAYTDSETDQLGYLLKQKESGRIRYLGFSSHASPETLTRFLDWYDGFDMAQIQLNYLDWTLLDAKRQYEILTERNIPVWVMEPLKGGRLSTLNDAASAALKPAAPNRSLSSWGFRWLMGLDNVQCVLSGMGSVEQVQENAATFSERAILSADEQKALDKAIDLFIDDLGVPCSACRYCCDGCPAGLNIPLIISAYNQQKISGATWRVDGFASAKGPEECIGCGSCAVHCPQKIDIPEVMRRFCEIRANK